MNVYIVTKVQAGKEPVDTVFSNEEDARLYLKTHYPTYTQPDFYLDKKLEVGLSFWYFDKTRCSDDTSIYLKLLPVMTRSTVETTVFVSTHT